MFHVKIVLWHWWDLPESTNALLIIKNNVGLVVPSVSVMKIVKHCEVIMRSSVNIKKVVSGEWERLLVSRMLLDIPCDLFHELNQHFMETSMGINTHCFILVKIIYSEFIKLHCFYTIKLTNLYLAGDSIRHKLNKTVLFKHQ